MVGKAVLTILCVVLVAAWAAPARASPALLVTKGPVQPVPSWTGPPIDPHAVQGQWFSDGHVKPYEFYDNGYGYGGSLWKGANAIEGYVNSLTFDGQGNITSFWINATIWNDDADSVGEWLEAANSHGEYRENAFRYVCDMHQVRLTTSFADDGILGNFPGPSGPYSGSELAQNIYAINYDQLAWYCWTPNNPDPNKTPWGSYMVPTYDFGDILHGMSSTRNLPFGLYNPVAPGSALYQFLYEAEYSQWDVFLNRTTSLKISDYFDSLTRDTGMPYPVPPSRSSDVSVFFVPEPGTLLLALFGALVLLGRKDK